VADNTNVKQNEIPVEKLNDDPAVVLTDAELDQISGGMLACNKLTPCI
jgi:bacteriocin-like protein